MTCRAPLGPLLRSGYSLLVVVALLAWMASARPLHRRAVEDRFHWVGIWSAMPQLVEPSNLPPVPFNGAAAVFSNSTIRQTIQIALDAQDIRLRVSNAFGVNDLSIPNVALSLPATQQAGTSALQVGSTTDVLFSGIPSIIIPAGGLAVSDPIQLAVATQSVVMIDMYLAHGQEGAAGRNRILHDSLGPNVVSRIDRDVLAQPGVKYAMLFEGVNDIDVADTDVPSQTEIGDQPIFAYRQLATRIHAAGLPFFGATITPFGSPSTSDYVQPYSEGREKRINAFNRESGVFDPVLDFDQVLRDAEAPGQLRAQYDSGDHLHPNEAGDQALADYFPLDLFVEWGAT
ncbi:uncharacterized protein N7482_008017 [Penicillium canariense]|uniref:SGNH hydrolase-type esterase domain-containing protein n=1 Tax=Penicillium canariense TaxID=189055 RepID=A0A9W9HT69_9EURO|nr:uncharacterized protein N7482_008017 [Penicillium canariense]KAJ5156917.1 hypothetical protein N7482_008017 [Penicillium canariense]